MLRAAKLVEKEIPDVQFIIAAPSDEIARLIDETRRGIKDSPQHCVTVVGQTRQVLKQARAAWVASGTATVETALMRCPMVIVYKTTWLTYLAGRLLVRIPFIGMVNVIAGREVCPEYIQGRATPSMLASAIKPLLSDTPARNKMLGDLDEVVSSLGGGGAAERAARIVDEVLEA